MTYKSVSFECKPRFIRKTFKIRPSNNLGKSYSKAPISPIRFYLQMLWLRITTIFCSKDIQKLILRRLARIQKVSLSASIISKVLPFEPCKFR